MDTRWTQPINKYWQRFGVRAFHRPEESPLRCSMHAFVALFQLWSSFLTLKYRSYWRHISVVFCTHSCKAISRGRSEPIYETYFTCCHSINKLLSNHSYFHFQKSCYSLRRIKKLMGGSMGGSGWIQHVFTCRSIPQMQYKCKGAAASLWLFGIILYLNPIRFLIWTNMMLTLSFQQ